MLAYEETYRSKSLQTRANVDFYHPRASVDHMFLWQPCTQRASAAPDVSAAPETAVDRGRAMLKKWK